MAKQINEVMSQYKCLEEAILARMGQELDKADFKIFEDNLQKATAKDVNIQSLLDFSQKFIKDNNLDIEFNTIKADWVKRVEDRKKEISEAVEEDQRKAQLQYLILSDEDRPQIIDHAVGKIEFKGKLLRYYGVRLAEKYTSNTDKGPKEREDVGPALILENGTVLTKHHRYRTKYEFNSQMTLKYNRWDEKGIQEFIAGDCEPKKHTFKKVFQRMRKHYEDYMVFEHDEWYDLNALWDMCTYFYDLIDKFMIIKHEGMSGSAKSKGMKISAHLAFNARIFLKPNPPNFFRFRHHNKSAIFFEEAERLFDDTKKGNAADDEMVEYLNGSYEKGNTVPRQDDNDKNLTHEFEPAGFSRIGSIKPLRGALEKRSITLHMIKAGKTDPRSKVEVPTTPTDPAIAEFKKTRSMMYVAGLQHYREYESALKKVNNDKMIDRQWATAKPILAMALCIDPKLEKTMTDFLVSIQAAKSGEEETSWNSIMADCLVRMYSMRKDPVFLDNNTLQVLFHERLKEATGEEYRKVSPKALAGVMNKLGFADFRAISSDGCKRGYKDLTFFRVCEYLIRGEILSIFQILKKVSEVSNCQYSDSDIKNWYAERFNESDTLSDTSTPTTTKVSDFSDTLTDTTLISVAMGGEDLSKSATPDDFIAYMKEQPGLQSTDTRLLEKFDKEFLEKMAREGYIFENPTGVYNLVL